MRRILGAVLVGLGIFGIALAIALPTAVVHASKKIPLDLNITLVSNGTAQVLNPTTGKVETHNLRATRFVKTDTSASNDTVTTVNETVCTVIDENNPPNCFNQSPTDPNRDPRLLSTTTDRVTVDRRTAEAVNIAGYHESINGSATYNGQPVKHVGIAYAFPIDTKKQTYRFFQPDLNAAFDAKFVGTAKVKGLTTYKFVSATGDQSYKINGTFDGTYNDTRTVWVEPRTGVIVKGIEDQTQTLSDGTVALKTTTPLTFSDAAQNYQANYAKDKIRSLDLAQIWGPIVCGIVGVAALIGGILLLRSAGGHGGDQGGRPRRGKPTPTDDSNYDDISLLSGSSQT